MKKITFAVWFGLVALCIPNSWAQKKEAKDRVVENTGSGPAVLWRDPTDIASRDLFYGPGGKVHEPHGTFTFVEEDLEGTNPKLEVRDQDGVRWKVKLGVEARPETAASRITWAVGYYANEDYFVPDLQVQGMPARLRRGQKLVDPGGTVHNVRLKRHLQDEKKIGIWQWRDDPFVGTRELNGLKVLMAVINNWDLKDLNNGVYQEGSERIYMITDLGSSFGTTGLTWPLEKAKGNLNSYRHSQFIRGFTNEAVDFRVPDRARWFCAVRPMSYIHRLRLQWVGRDIPREHARWMGALLARLSPQQIRDAFRAAGYSPDEVEEFAQVVKKRIAVLTDL